ncbi:MAG TPA: acetate kinase [Candidatus Polarisedimenticolaceae bacterium]|nr:acetate kinase [Candidatus Polarisedimenticolaceae bacterium]
MNVLVLNCGSSSVKFQILATDLDAIETGADRRLARGTIERVGGHGLITLEVAGGGRTVEDAPIRDHRAAVDRILRWIVSEGAAIPGIRSISNLDAVGHRVVHGGERFRRSEKIDAAVIEGIEACIELAPLHNPANLKGIRAATELLGSGVPQVAVFDTAFHAEMPETSYLYGLPYSLYRRYRIRRYGFHGTSHRYVAYRYRTMQGLAREQVNLITLHLGNGCSACAIRGGASVDTSMGFTPVEGLIMGTRSGDLDPSILDFLAQKEGMGFQEIDALLNKQSGLLGISGLTGDMRDLLAEEAENGDRRARLAIDLFCLRVRKYIGAYWASYGADAVVFAGGIGENSAPVRERILSGLERIGIVLDREANAKLPQGEAGRISTEGSSLGAWVIPTDEELLIARDTVRVVRGAPRRW